MVDDRHDRTPAEIPDRELKVQIDKKYFKAPNSLMTGYDVLHLAEKLPPDNYAIYLKVEGGQPERIGLDETVDLSRPGVERFVTLPLDQTEGLGARRDFGLPDEDVDWLISKSHRFEFVAEAGVLREERVRDLSFKSLQSKFRVVVKRQLRSCAARTSDRDERHLRPNSLQYMEFVLYFFSSTNENGQFWNWTRVIWHAFLHVVTANR